MGETKGNSGSRGTRGTRGIRGMRGTIVIRACGSRRIGCLHIVIPQQIEIMFSPFAKRRAIQSFLQLFHSFSGYNQ